MTQTAGPTATTTQAATLAQVTPRTIRRWAAAGRVTATKTNNRWAIDTISLSAYVADRIADRADYSPYADKAKARQNVVDLIETGAVIRLTATVAQVVSKTDARITYVVDTATQTCDCRAHGRLSYCSHLTTVNALTLAA